MGKYATGRKGKRRPMKSGETKSGPARIEYAVFLRRDGKRWTEAVAAIMERFRVSRATAAKDVNDADGLILEAVEAEIPTARARLIESGWEAMQIARAAKSVNAIVQAGNFLKPFFGIDESTTSTKATIVSEGDAILAALGLTPAQRRQREEEIKAALAELPKP